jgi:hypothetical protein
MLGSTLGFAAASTYPSPFVSGGVANVGIVVGANAPGGLDAIAGVSIGAALANELASQTTSGGGSTVTSGEGVNLKTPSRNLYYGESINSARQVLTEAELPNILADGTFSDLTGTSYTYSQTVVLGDTVTTFDTNSVIDDPEFYLDIGTTATDPLYNYTLSLNKNLNVSDSTNVQGQKINILGVDYIIGADSTNTTLYLDGSGETVIVSQGEPKTITVDGTEHQIELVAATSSTGARISVDGTTKQVTETGRYNFPGDLVVYIKDVTYQEYAGGLQQVELIIGANSIKLIDGQPVKYGSDLTTNIKGTLVDISATGENGMISGFTVQIAGKTSKTDFITLDMPFVDPVFNGLSVQFGGVEPALDDESRGRIMVDTDLKETASVTFKTAKMAADDEPVEFMYAYDNNTATSGVSPLLAHEEVRLDEGRMWVFEGQNAKENDYIVINQGDSGTILQVGDLSNCDVDNTQAEDITFTDAITGDTSTVTLTNSTGGFTKSAITLFGGTGYTIWCAGDGSSLNITWDGSTARTLFPRIKLKDGGWLAFLTETTVANATSVLLPDGLTTLATSGTTVSNETATYTPQGIKWLTENSAGSVKFYGAEIGGTYCEFNSSKGPAVLFIEPKKWDDSTYGDAICIPMTTAGTTTVEIAIDTPLLNGTNSGWSTLDSDSDISQIVDKYGTLISKTSGESNENGEMVISYPSSQMVMNVLVTEEGASLDGSETDVGELGTKVYEDTEIANIQDRNLIVVGGSCINTVAANLLGGSYCESAFTTATGVGPDQFLIKVFNSPYTTGRVAMLVAGYEAADTAKAADYVKNELTTTDVGTELKKVTATYADVA